MLIAFAYGARTFRVLETKMAVVNDVYVPALKALNQVESSFYLLESDLDKSLSEGILRPKDTLEAILSSRLDLLRQLNRGDSSLVLQDNVAALQDAYRSSSEILEKLYRDWDARANYEAALSERRANFRLKLKTLIRELDQEMRATSMTMQSELQNVSLALTLMLGVCALTAFFTTYWLARSLRPLTVLAESMRNISERGLSESVVRHLAELPETRDEIGTLSRESFQMAASLLDSSKLLRDQKQNLERAHSEMARQNEELKNTQAKLLHSEKLGLVGRMAAQMAHEIRNPLNALNLHAELLEEQLRTDTKARESLTPLRKEINRLISVTESYLDLSRAPRLQKTGVQLNDLVEELHDLYAPVLREKGIFFTCDLGDLPEVSVDRGQISQVLGNLIKNASEAFEGITNAAKYIRVITQHQEESREVLLTVMDNGKGIEDSDHGNIFSPFFTSKAQGTGLGLTFSRQVVEAHGGSMTFTSQFQHGTKFTLRLPMLQFLRTGENQWKGIEQKSL